MNKKTRVVITGLGIISPCGNSIEQFWNAIVNGGSGIDYIKKFPTEKFAVKIGGEVKNFDPLCYGITKKELNRMDPFVQFAIAGAHEAIRDSGLVFAEYNPKVGIIIGSGMGGTTTHQKVAEQLFSEGPNVLSPFSIPSIMLNAAAAEISIKHKIHGMSYTVNSACASSLHAIINSVMCIHAGIADIMLTGGTEVLHPLPFAGFINLHGLSQRDIEPSKASCPFDVNRDGFVIAEGAGILVIESLDSALTRGAHIYAEIIGFGCSSDAYHITKPGNNGAEHAIEIALQSAGILPKDVSYINAHGTSTFFNDAIETESIKNVFGKDAYHVNISSTKSMTGHMLGAAAAVETIVCALALKHNEIPPTINYEHPDPMCDLNYTPNVSRKTEVNIAINNSFGFGGHNGCLVLRKYIE